MQADQRTMQVQVREAPKAYLVTWMAAAAFALGYLTIAATRPELLSSVLPLADTAEEQLTTSRAADVADDVASLRTWVNDLQHEVAAAKSAMQDQAARTLALTQRIAAAEERLPPVREVRSETPPQPPAVPARQTSQRTSRTSAAPPHSAAGESARAAAPAQAPATAEPSVASAGLKVLNAPHGETPIATGSLPSPAAAAPPFGGAAAAPPFGAPKVTTAQPSSSPRGIVIGSTDSLDRLRARWGELSGRAPDVLKPLAPRYRLDTDNRAGVPFTLLAGPFASTAEAARACTSLRAKGVPCRLAEYGGSSL